MLDVTKAIELHAQFIDWCNYVTINNEALRPHVYPVAKPGAVWEINIDVPTASYNGLRLMVRKRGERPSQAQADHVQLRRRMGYYAIFVDNIDEACRVAVGYLRGRWTVVDRSTT